MVAPNVDTTYTVGQIDLSDGPLVVDVPDTERALLRAPVHGRLLEHVRLRRAGAPPARSPGPTCSCRPGTRARCRRASSRSRSPTNLIWLIGRTLVKDAADLAPVTELMREYRLTPLARLVRRASAPTRSSCRRSRRSRTSWCCPRASAYLDQLGEALAAQPAAERPTPARCGRSASRRDRPRAHALHAGQGAVRAALAGRGQGRAAAGHPRRRPRELVQPRPQQRLAGVARLHRRLRPQLPRARRDRAVRAGRQHGARDRLPVRRHGQRRAPPERPPPLPHPLRARASCRRRTRSGRSRCTRATATSIPTRRAATRSGTARRDCAGARDGSLTLAIQTPRARGRGSRRTGCPPRRAGSA